MHGFFTALIAFTLFAVGIWAARRNLHRSILIGLVAGLVAGVLAALHNEPEVLDGTWLAFVQPLTSTVGAPVAVMVAATDIVGDIFIMALKLVIIPLVVGTIVSGVVSVGDMRRLGRIGGKTLLYYCCTTALAVTVGLVTVNVIRPGIGADLELASMDTATLAKVEANKNQDLGEFVRRQLTSVLINPFKATAEGKVLPTIFFSLLLGAVIASSGPQGEPLALLFSSLSEVMMRMVGWILLLAPAGAFALLASQVAESGVSVLATLAKYMATVLTGLGIHAFVTLPLLLVVFGRVSIRRFTSGVRDAIVLAFSTSSSSATLPVTMECLTKNLHVQPHVSSFVLPLGATINMDGTALYESVAVMFIAQAYGIDMTLGQQIIIFLTATLASIGAAGIPSAGLFMMVIVLEAVGLPLTGIGLILAVDRILDMCRTTVNVVGDAVGAVIIDTSEGGAASRAAAAD